MGQVIRSTRTDQRAVAFVDISGFTAFTEVRGDDDAADLAEAFADLARATLGPNDRLVKTIGDAVLLLSTSADDAIRLVTDLVSSTHAHDGFPLLRAGIAVGPVVFRGGDVYGTTVNIAARVAGRADPGHVLATSEVARIARRLGFPTRSHGLTELRNLTDPIELFTVDTDGECHCAHVDPVCRAHVTQDRVAMLHDFRQRTFRFCSLECFTRFDIRPERYSDAVHCFPTK